MGGGCPLSTPPLTTGLDPPAKAQGGGKTPKRSYFPSRGFSPIFFWQILAQKVFSSKIDLEFGCIGSDLPTCRFPPPTPGGWWVECQDWGVSRSPSDVLLFILFPGVCQHCILCCGWATFGDARYALRRYRAPQCLAKRLCL